MNWLTELIFAADLVISIALTIRIIMRRRPVAVSLAWLTVVLVFPFIGAVVYLSFGELRLGSRRAVWAVKVNAPFQRWLGTIQHRKFKDWSTLHADCEPLSRLTEAAVDVPALSGNELQLMTKAGEFAQSLIRDIDAAKRTCHMEFYICSEGGLADDVAEALLRAVERGVICRVLLDDVGSRDFLRGSMVRRLRKAGVHVIAALRAGWFRSMFVRFDLRMHRKIVVIDGEIAYSGSQNMVDPGFFKQDAGVGQWVDAMLRVRGPAVEALAQTFLGDWELETREPVESIEKTGDYHPLEPCGDAVVQVVPSGPLVSNDAIQKILLMAIYAARRELILTTPYFVPDDSLQIALMSAAERGVDVTLIVPAKVDSKLVSLASRSYQDDLAGVGVRIARFEGGLLHTKSITVDGQFSFFGSLNLDPRSLHLNFEITLLVYNHDFTTRLRELQMSYLAECTIANNIGEMRSGLRRLAENTARLLGPLL